MIQFTPPPSKFIKNFTIISLGIFIIVVTLVVLILLVILLTYCLLISRIFLSSSPRGFNLTQISVAMALYVLLIGFMLSYFPRNALSLTSSINRSSSSSSKCNKNSSNSSRVPILPLGEMIFPFKHFLKFSNLIPKSVLEIRYFNNLHAQSVFWFSSNFCSVQ